MVFFKVSIGLGQWLRRNVKKFDVVHVHALFSFAPVAAAFIARQAGVPYVVRPLGVLAPYGMTKHHPALKRVSFALIERRLIESADAIHFTSRIEQLEAEALGLKCQSVLIPLGIDFGGAPKNTRRKTDQSGAFELLFLSRIDPKKNIEGLLKAIQLVRMKKLKVNLTIAGDGDPGYIAKLQAFARLLRIAEYVRWIGYVDGEQKKEVFAGASAFVLPSYSENFGIAVAEALAAGLPCLVSRRVALSDQSKRRAPALSSIRRLRILPPALKGLCGIGLNCWRNPSRRARSLSKNSRWRGWERASRRSIAVFLNRSARAK